MDSDKSVVGDMGKMAVKKLGKFVSSHLQKPSQPSEYTHQTYQIPPAQPFPHQSTTATYHPEQQATPYHQYHPPPLNHQQKPPAPHPPAQTYHPQYQQAPVYTQQQQHQPLQQQKPYHQQPQQPPFGGQIPPMAPQHMSFNQPNSSFGHSVPNSGHHPASMAYNSSHSAPISAPATSHTHPSPPAPNHLGFASVSAPSYVHQPSAPPRYPHHMPPHSISAPASVPFVRPPTSCASFSNTANASSDSDISISQTSRPSGYPQANLHHATPHVPPSSTTGFGHASMTQLSQHMGNLSVAGNLPSTVPVAPPPISAGKLQKGWGSIFDHELLMQVKTRPHSARVTLGDTAVIEARKGLSRVLRPWDEADLELFAQQLRNVDPSACEPDFRRMDEGVMCFAVSYVHSSAPVGRFKFTQDQWHNFKAACAEIAECGVTEMRVWLDQCLWLRDASQGAWAHTGMMPYVLWPVISLGVKAAGQERTLDTFTRMWPFVEEVAGLWSMGVIITSELRGENVQSGCRRWLSFQLRHRCEPEESMRLILQNIFHGAVDHLQTGWTADVEELKEMARWNFICDSSAVLVGSDWRSRIASLSTRRTESLVSGLRLSFAKENDTGSDADEDQANLYLDGSRVLQREGWNGLAEWLSGHEAIGSCAKDIRRLQEDLRKVQLMTTEGEYQILCDSGYSYSTEAIWLLVAMDGRTSRFCRGHVAWTKVMHGASTCRLKDAISEQKQHVIENVLQEQIGKPVQVKSMVTRDSEPIEWT